VLTDTITPPPTHAAPRHSDELPALPTRQELAANGTQWLITQHQMLLRANAVLTRELELARRQAQSSRASSERCRRWPYAQPFSSARTPRC
jgi:hypothetical protein